MDNRCVICGEIIQEGRMVCPNCSAGNEPKPESEKQDNSDYWTLLSTFGGNYGR